MASTGDGTADPPPAPLTCSCTVLGAEDGVDHWAHLGGFGLGMILALILLATRLTDAHGGDLLSVLFGRHAWALVGRPNRFVQPA